MRLNDGQYFQNIAHHLIYFTARISLTNSKYFLGGFKTEEKKKIGIETTFL